MHYKIVIMKMIENPNYQKELEAYNAAQERRERYHNSYDRIDAEMAQRPHDLVAENALATIVDEEQFKAIQKAALETFNQKKDV